MAIENLVDINDVYENLEKLESNLLEMETATEKENIDLTSIHTSFRHAHNLKSLLAMLNKNGCSKLMHAIESNFDLIRNGKRSITNDLIQKSLNALDCIQENINNIFEDSEQINTIYIEIEVLFKEEPDTVKSHSIDFPVSSESELLIFQSLKDGHCIYQIEKLFTSDLSKENFENMPVFDSINEIGNLIASSPDYEHIPKEGNEHVIKILFSSKLAEDELTYSIFDPFHKIDLSHPHENPIEKTPGNTLNSNLSIDKSEKPGFLIIEDDFENRKTILNSFLSFGNCDIATSEEEIMYAFETSIATKNHYECIYLGSKETLKYSLIIDRIRKIEQKNNIYGFLRCKIIFASENPDNKDIINLYRKDCDFYVAKPIDSQKLRQIINEIL